MQARYQTTLQPDEQPKGQEAECADPTQVIILSAFGGFKRPISEFFRDVVDRVPHAVAEA